MVNVAILGFGTVGSGVAEVLAKNGEHIDQKVETPVRLKYILDVRDFPESPFQDKIIHDFSTIENDKSVDIVVETIGGATVARTIRAGRCGPGRAWFPPIRSWWPSAGTSSSNWRLKWA